MALLRCREGMQEMDHSVILTDDAGDCNDPHCSCVCVLYKFKQGKDVEQ